MEREGDGDNYCDWRTRNGHLRIGTSTGRVGKRWSNRDYPDDSIMISQYTEKCHGGPKRLAVIDSSEIPSANAGEMMSQDVK